MVPAHYKGTVSTVLPGVRMNPTPNFGWELGGSELVTR